MKFTTTILALALAAVSFCQSTAPANKTQNPSVSSFHDKQHKGLSKAEREKIREEVFAELKLSADQIKKIKDLDADLASKVKAARKADKGLPTPDKKSEMKELHEWYQGQLKGILGEAEAKKYNTLLKEKLKAARKAEEKEPAAAKP